MGEGDKKVQPRQGDHYADWQQSRLERTVIELFIEARGIGSGGQVVC
jgi:hypothetical protein